MTPGDNFDEEDCPVDFEPGKAWAEIRLITPEGVETVTRLPKLTKVQGIQLEVLVARLVDNKPVLVMCGGKEY